MPSRQTFRPAREEKIAGIFALKRNLPLVGWAKKMGQVAVHELRVVRFVRWQVMQIAVGIMEGKIEGRAANQGRQPGHRLLASSMAPVESFQPSPQDRLLKLMSEFNRMSSGPDAGPEFGQLDAKLFQGFMPFLVWAVVRPDPLDA